jgi:3-oxoacyl-[acyl-carrier-protein] synthase-3
MRNGPAEGIVVAGWGTALPKQRVTNEDLAQRLDTSDEWIIERTGIRERRLAGPDESSGPLAVTAASKALAHAGLTARDIDLIVVATSTPEKPMPATAAILAAELGTSAGGFDLNAACAGFGHALVTTASMLSSGVATTALLVGVDTMSSIVDPDDRSTAILFGDGAAALVLADESAVGDSGLGPVGTGPTSPAPGLVASDIVHDPDGIDLLVVEAGGSGRPADAESVAAGAHYMRMDGREVFRRAVRAVTSSVERTLRRGHCRPEDVAVFVPHQANARIVDAALPRLGIPPERTLQSVERYGNTSAASIPLSLAEAADSGGIVPGDLVLVCGFGAGLSVATALWRWDVAPAPVARTAAAHTGRQGSDEPDDAGEEVA